MYVWNHEDYIQCGKPIEQFNDIHTNTKNVISKIHTIFEVQFIFGFIFFFLTNASLTLGFCVWIGLNFSNENLSKVYIMKFLRPLYLEWCDGLYSFNCFIYVKALEINLYFKHETCCV